jgi:hypothetical protein
MRAKPAITATATIGTLSENTELHDDNSSSSPPTTGPRPMPTVDDEVRDLALACPQQSA